MPVIEAQKVPKKEVDIEDELAVFCYYFPQYTFKQAQLMPYKRVRKMLKVAEQERARFMLDLTYIVTAPHTKKGSGVKKMVEHFKKIYNS